MVLTARWVTAYIPGKYGLYLVAGSEVCNVFEDFVFPRGHVVLRSADDNYSTVDRSGTRRGYQLGTRRQTKHFAPVTAAIRRCTLLCPSSKSWFSLFFVVYADTHSPNNSVVCGNVDIKSGKALRRKCTVCVCVVFSHRASSSLVTIRVEHGFKDSSGLPLFHALFFLFEQQSSPSFAAHWVH